MTCQEIWIADFADDIYRFQVVLHENGDIDFLYQSMIINADTSSYCGSAGIEDSRGIDGLNYVPFCNDPPASNKAVRFYRPAPAARVQIDPQNQGQFFSPRDEKAFAFTVINTGDLGADTYDLIPSSAWSVTLYAANGTTPLTDTDTDGIIDTGAISQGGSRSFVAKVNAPGSAIVGDSAGVEVIAQSSINPAKSSTTHIQGAIPARFAQIFSDYADGVMNLYLVSPTARAVKSTSPDYEYGGSMALANSPDGNFIYAWEKYRCLPPSCDISIKEAFYTILDHDGNPVLPPTKLIDHSGVSMDTWDGIPLWPWHPMGNNGITWL